MQCLVSPTRKEIDSAHAKRVWLDVGIPSVKNLRFINWKRRTLWWLLGITSVSVHVLWNSVLFSTLERNDYLVMMVFQDFLQGDSPNCMNLSNSSSYSDVIYDMYEAAKADNLTKLSPTECIQQYVSEMQTHWSNVFIVTQNFSSLSHLSVAIAEPDLNWTSQILSRSRGDMSWLCSDYHTGHCTLAAALTNSSRWTLFEESREMIIKPNFVDHCLASSRKETCKLQYSSAIVLVVIASNVLKLFGIMSTLKLVNGQHLITIGDAMASFLSKPDPNTAGACIGTKETFRKMLSDPEYHLESAGDTRSYIHSGDGTVWQDETNYLHWDLK
ncbi:hypothetical protein MMC14_007119 [Varicellaria rhodocarpa]|nr:hypothetical protein [Varicellaria rhodocarpa]